MITEEVEALLVASKSVLLTGHVCTHVDVASNVLLVDIGIQHCRLDRHAGSVLGQKRRRRALSSDTAVMAWHCKAQ